MSTTVPTRDPALARALGRAAALMSVAVIGLAGCASYENRAGRDDYVARGDFTTASIAGPGAYASPVDTGVAAWDGDISAPGMTAAHASLPLGSWARVTNTSTAAATNVRVTRRLVPGGGRDIELSRDAAAAVGALQGGPAVVLIEPLDAARSAMLDRSAAAAPVAPVYVAPAAPAPVVASAPTAGVAYDPNLSTSSIARAPAPAADSAAYGRQRFVQLGSYRNPQNAYRMRSRVEREGLANGAYGAASVTRAMVGGVEHYRVRLGPIASVAEGQRALRQAQALGHNDARLITP